MGMYLPPIGVAIFFGALVSALMSSADSALLAPASVIGWDVVKYFRPDTDEKQILKICRWSVPVLGAFSLYLALTHQTVYDLMVNSWSILLATLFVPLTAGIWWSKANYQGALSSMIAGLFTWLLLMELTPDLPADLLAVPVGLIFIVFISLKTAKTTPPLPLRDESGNSISLANRLGLPNWNHKKT